MPVAAYVVGVAGGEFGERGLGGALVGTQIGAPAGFRGRLVDSGLGVPLLLGGLLVAECGLQAHAVLDETVVGQQALLHQEALRAGLAELVQTAADGGGFAFQVALLAGLVLDVLLELVGCLVDHCAAVQQFGALGLPGVLGLGERALQSGLGVAAQGLAGVAGHAGVEDSVDVGEEAEELLDQVHTPGHRLAERLEPARTAEQRSHPVRQRQDSLDSAPGREVDEVGGVLAAQQLHRGEKTPRGQDAPGNELARIGEVVEGARAGVCDAHHQRVAGRAPGAAHPLDVSCGGRRQGGEDHRLQLTDIDPEFQGRGAGQYVGVGVAAGALPEALLDGFALLAGQHAGVLGGDHAVRLRLPVQATVVVGAEVPRRTSLSAGRGHHQRTLAALEGARQPLPHRNPVRMNGLRPPALGAGHSCLGSLTVVQRTHADMTGRQPVHPVVVVLAARPSIASTPVRERFDVRFGQPWYQIGQVGGSLSVVQPEAAVGEVGVPAVLGIGPLEVGTPRAGTHQQERRRVRAASERRHALGAASPDGVAGAALLVDVGVQPGVLNATALPQMLQQATDVAFEAALAVDPDLRQRVLHHCSSRVVDPVQDLAAVQMHLEQRLCGLRRPNRVLDVDLGSDGPSELKGATQPGVQSELQKGVERQALTDQRPGAGGDAPLLVQQPCHSVHIMQIRRDDGCQQVLLRYSGATYQRGDQLVERQAVFAIVVRVQRAPSQLLVNKGAQ